MQRTSPTSPPAKAMTGTAKSAVTSSLHESRIGLHFDLFAELTHLEYRIDDGIGIDLENDSGLHESPESG